MKVNSLKRGWEAIPLCRSFLNNFNAYNFWSLSGLPHKPLMLKTGPVPKHVRCLLDTQVVWPKDTKLFPMISLSSKGILSIFFSFYSPPFNYILMVVIKDHFEIFHQDVHLSVWWLSIHFWDISVSHFTHGETDITNISHTDMQMNNIVVHRCSYW